MDLSRISDRELLEAVIGPEATSKLYRGALAPLFHNQDIPNPQNYRLHAARELFIRALHEDLMRGGPLSSPDQVRQYLIAWYAGQSYESFVGLFLDAQHIPLAIYEMFRGTLTQTAVYPREVVRQALRYNAAAVIFAHNHPSGVAEPSRADEALTQTLRQALDLVDVRVLDHFVVAGRVAVSMAEKGII
jgi:DNA repair protein RadC